MIFTIKLNSLLTNKYQIHNEKNNNHNFNYYKLTKFTLIMFLSKSNSNIIQGQKKLPTVHLYGFSPSQIQTLYNGKKKLQAVHLYGFSPSQI
jgi:hypothetical protein